MTESEKKGSPSIPAWQMANKAPVMQQGAVANGDGTPPAEATLEQARRFLQDPEVQNTDRNRKAEFLRSKGFDQSVLDALLSEESDSEKSAVPERDGISQSEAEASNHSDQDVSEAQSGVEGKQQEQGQDQAPIITYPEFLAQRHRPSPLITMDGFFNTLYAFGGLSALLYGTSKLVLAPMVESLTDARLSLHGTAADNLAKLVEKLESAVSEIPAAAGPRSALGSRTPRQAGEDEADSQYDDPTELFHRDVGVQTSPPASPGPGGAAHLKPSPETSESTQQAQRIAKLAGDGRAICTGLTSQSEDLAETNNVLSVFQDDLDKLRLKAPSSFAGAGGYAPTRAGEPDDEIARARDNIRRMKGVLLSARSFPATVR